MALLNAIGDCKIGDANAWYTSLEGTLASSYSNTNFSYGTPAIFNKTFSRNETLKRVFIQINPANRSVEPLPFNVSLCQYKSCTVTSASPAVVTITAHGYATGDKVRFAGTTIPTGMTKGIAYYVNVTGANTFILYDTYANAMAGGATGQINTSSTGSAVVCYKVFAETTTSFNALFGNYMANLSATTTTVVHYLQDVDYAVTNAAGLWAFMASTDDATRTANTGINVIASFGSTTATAVSGTDNLVIGHSVDFSTGWTWAGMHNLVWNRSDPWLHPNLLVDPAAASIGNMTINASANIYYGSRAGFSFGRPLKFTAQLSAGATSATLTEAFAGTTGTHILQLFPRNEADNFQQISASFTNGSTAVTFSALTYDATDRGAICFKMAAPYTLTVNTGSLINQVSSCDLSFCSIFAQETRSIHAFTTAEVAAGTGTMTVDRNTGWAAGDKFYIGGQKTKTASLNDMATEYTISTVTPGAGTDVVTFSPNITATYDRLAGAVVAISSFAANRAFSITRATGSGTAIGISPSSFGAKNLIGINGVYVGSPSSDRWTVDSNCMPFYLYKLHMASVTIQAGRLGGFYKEMIGNAGGFPQLILGLSGYAYDTPTYAQDLVAMRISSLPVTLSGNFPINYKRLYLDGMGSSGLLSLGGEGWTMDTVKVWNGQTGGSALGITGLFGNDLKNVYAENASYGIMITSGKCLIKNLYLGTTYPNTYDLQFSSSGGFSQVELQNPAASPTVDMTNRTTNMSAIGYIAITNIAGVAANCRVIYKYGESTISGAGLADTTSRLGNQSLVFGSYSGLNNAYWEQAIPTGNIQNKDMMIGVWVKINSSAYWAGTKQMPRLTINYDNGTTVYAEAAQSTDWQFLSVPFKPTTTYGAVLARLSVRSDAGIVNSKVYFADMSVLYPAGYTLNLGAFNNISGGLPVTPTISTTVSAADVWAANPAQFGANTAGDKLNSIKKDTGLIPALL